MEKFLSNQIDRSLTYLVAASGGPDSMALLNMLINQRINIMVAHVNYKKRMESDEEQQMVKNFCSQHQIPFFVTQHNQKEKGNFQNQARIFRYQFFKNLCETHHLSGLFVGHHLDDLLETYYFQKERNSVVDCYGIQSQVQLFGINVLRPLLSFTKKELIEYCNQNQVPYRIDQTNSLKIYKRNKIRLEIIDSMSIEEKLKVLLEINLLNEEKKKTNEQICKLYATICQNNHLQVSKFKQINPEVQKEIFINYLKTNKMIEVMHLSKRRIEDLLQKINCSKPNLVMELSPSVSLIKSYDFVYLSNVLNECSYSYQIQTFENMVTTYFKTSQTGNTNQGVKVEREDFPLTIRTIQPKDVIQIKNGKKDIRRIFIDMKIPLSLRKTWPILVNCQGKVLLISELTKDYERKSLQSNFFVIK